MKKTFFFAATIFAAMTLAFTACDKKDNGNTPEDPTETPDTPVVSSRYDGIWVSDSILDDTDKYPHAVMWEVVNDKEVQLHGWGKATWSIEDHFITITLPEEMGKIELEEMIYDEEAQTASFYVMSGATLLNVPEDAMLYMYRLPQPQGENLPVNEANILGKWRTTYEINAEYDADGKRVSETRFYHDYSIWEIKANGAAVSYSDPYSYEGWWVLDDGKLALYTGEKPATMKADYFFNVELKSNYMHLTRYNYNEAGKITSSNEQFLYRK